MSVPIGVQAVLLVDAQGMPQGVEIDGHELQCVTRCDVCAMPNEIPTLHVEMYLAGVTTARVE